MTLPHSQHRPIRGLKFVSSRYLTRGYGSGTGNPWVRAYP